MVHTTLELDFLEQILPLMKIKTHRNPKCISSFLDKTLLQITVDKIHHIPKNAIKMCGFNFKYEN